MWLISPKVTCHALSCGMSQELRDQIERLEAQELSLEDLAEEDTTYTLLGRYKAKFVKAWDKLCKVKGRASTTGRPTETKFRFEGKRPSGGEPSIAHVFNVMWV